jgi:hypothetical protein
VRRYGIAPSTAREQAQKPQASKEPFQPLPPPTGTAPFRLTTAELEIAAASGVRRFHVLGDSGGVKDPNPQTAVARALVADVQTYGAEFAYHVGDVVYFNGARAEYPPQFQEPYESYNLPILAIPGNHDGDPEEDGEASLAAFVRYFCAAQPELLPEVEEYNRDTMTEPNVYWTLCDGLVTIVGCYSNVPAGGVIKPDQAEWLAGELTAAPTDRPLIVALHHPPYSCDTHHGGSQGMGEVLDAAFERSGRVPEMVLSGHVHDAQFFTRTLNGKQVAYVVIGNGGYHNLHALAADAEPGLEVAPGVTFDYGDASEWGFLRLAAEAGQLSGEYVGVARDGTVSEGKHAFSVPVG